MNAFTIKVIAVVSMIIDHVGFVFFPQYVIFRIFGRLAFPLFAFLVSEGFTKTSDVKKYQWRFATFAVLSQIPYILMVRAGGGMGLQLNIFFTLSAGLLGLVLINKYKNLFVRSFIVLFIVLFAMFFRFEYGAYGVLLIFLSYLFIKNKRLGIYSIVIVSILNVVYRILYLGTFLQIFALGTLPIMNKYNGEKGNGGYRNWFYYIYPVHMLIIVLIAYLIE